jgi:hypothetical protein
MLHGFENWNGRPIGRPFCFAPPGSSSGVVAVAVAAEIVGIQIHVVVILS